MEEGNKENKISPALFTKLMQSEAELTKYLKNIRCRPKQKKVIAAHPRNIAISPKQPVRQKKPATMVKVYVEDYLKLVKEATSLENESGRKILTKLIQYLQEFPTMAILLEKINSFGREHKKLRLNESAIMAQVNDEMIPLFQKVLQKVEFLKKQAESKKLMQLGQRIAHLQKLMEISSQRLCFAVDRRLRILEPGVEKYLIMEDNIARAEKNFGRFSQTFHKNQEVFSNINRVYSQISKSKEVNH